MLTPEERDRLSIASFTFGDGKTMPILSDEFIATVDSIVVAHVREALEDVGEDILSNLPSRPNQWAAGLQEAARLIRIHRAAHVIRAHNPT